MSEVTLGHEIVGLNGTVNVVLVDTDSDTHEHVLWPLRCSTIDLEEV